MNRAVAFNVDLGTGELPEWVELLPPGPEVVGRDGRRWLLTDPRAVVAAFERRGAPLPIDWEHATEVAAPEGKPAPAAGWIEALEVRDGGSVWGRVSWTPRAAEMVRNREYRFLSPVFTYRKGTLEIVELTSAGLTNQPNLHLRALNRAQEGHAMWKKLMEALGLAEGATEDQAVEAVGRLRSDLDAARNRITALEADLATARNRAQAPDLAKFVPRADYDAAVERATNAERRLREHLEAQREKEIEAEIEAALKAGKITPATVEYHKAQCRAEGGLERFREFVRSAPVVAPESDLGKKKPDPGASLPDAAAAVCRNLGLDPEEYKKALA